MKRLRGGREEPHLLNDKALPDKGGLLKPGIFSLLLHIALVVILIFSARSTITRVGPPVYRVTLRPFSAPGSGIQQGSSTQGLPGPPGGLSAPAIAEKPKPDENLKRTWIVESTKPHQKKVSSPSGNRARDNFSA